MALTIFSSAAKVAEASIDELESSIKFLILAEQLRPRIGEKVDWNALGDIKSMFQSYTGYRDFRSGIVFKGSLVTLSGIFEHFVRRLIQDGISWLLRNVKSYNDVATTIRNQHLYRTGQALVTIHRPLEEMTIDFDAICKNLGTCTLGPHAPALNTQAFAIHINNLTPDRIEEALGRIDHTIKWDTLGSDDRLRSHFKTTKSRETANAIQDALREFIRRRNQIAHTGGGPDLTAADIQSTITFIKILCQVLASALEADLIARR